MKKKKLKGKKLLSIHKENHFSFTEVLLIVFISVFFGGTIGYLLTYHNSNLQLVRSNTNLGEVVDTYHMIVDQYYDDVDEAVLAEAAIQGMVSSLGDPYSKVIDQEASSSFQETVDGEYMGIGVTLTYQEEYSFISEMVKDGPASREGLEVGDVILEVNGHNCQNLYPKEIGDFMDQNKVSLKVRRGEETLEFTVSKEKIPIQNVVSKMYESKIGYLQIKVFSANSYQQFQDALDELEKKKMGSLILDLRDNPGGHLLQAKKILSLFFDKKTVLYQVERNGHREMVHSTSREKRAYPIVVLMNEGTASAAEVVASCFQENYAKSSLVGVSSYGKGKVQKSLSLNSGTRVQFTTEKWLTSKGKSVSDGGVAPDVVVTQDSSFYVDYLEKNDSQLQKALSILK